MAHQSDRNELLAAWRALNDATQARDGWSTITVAPGIRAGRHFPGNEEALVVGFTAISIPPADHLPQGRGFLVATIHLDAPPLTRWLALARRPEGSADLFATMALDIIATLESARSLPEERRFQLFLARIRAWQDFMRRGTETTLSPQEEIGLAGELLTLQAMIAAGLRPSATIEAWEGPLGGIQDFALGTGAIEVKTTIASAGFPAVIDSLDQLDDATRQPLYLVGVRLHVDEHGSTLPALIDATRTLTGNDAAKTTLESKLLHAGYTDAAAPQYQRRFTATETRMHIVNNTFPRLTKATVPQGITDARYHLDLDHVTTGTSTMHEALCALGVL